MLVHKFDHRGAVQDRIDRLIESRREPASDDVGGGAELLLTEMSDRALPELVALDLRTARDEGENSMDFRWKPYVSVVQRRDGKALSPAVKARRP